MNRRSLLALLGAAPLTGPAAVKAALASDGLGVAAATLSGTGGYPTCDPAPAINHARRIVNRLRDRREQARYVTGGSAAPHIAAKRSWSLAFKAHVQVQEEAEFHSMAERLEGLDNAGLLEICRIMGIEP